MKFIDYDHNFCEGKINGMPEYFNSITSLVFVGYGLYGLSQHYKLFDKPIQIILRSNSFIIKLIYSTFVVIGYGSAGYHWTGQIGWALLDEVPMIVCLFIGMSYLWQTYDLVKKGNSRIMHFNISHVVIVSFMFIFMVINTMENYRKVFPYFFTTSVVSFYLLLRLTMNSFDKKYLGGITKIGNQNVYIIVCGGIVWYFTELVCNYYQNKFLLIGHPLWHLLISYSFYNIIQIVYFINCFSQIKTLLNRNDIHIGYNKFFLLEMTPSTSLSNQTA